MIRSTTLTTKSFLRVSRLSRCGMLGQRRHAVTMRCAKLGRLEPTPDFPAGLNSERFEGRLGLSPSPRRNLPFSGTGAGVNVHDGTSVLASALGLQKPTDWEEGWIWMWKGRRDHIKEDVLSGKVANFSGHFALVTKDGQAVAFGPKYADDVFQGTLERILSAIVRRDYKEIAAAIEDKQLPAELTMGCTYHLSALEAGITIKKFRIRYSPSRLRLVADHAPQVMSGIRYSWNVDINSLRLNCTTIFQAWDIVQDLPWFPKMKDMYSFMEEHAQTSELTHEDLLMHYATTPSRKPAKSMHAC